MKISKVFGEHNILVNLKSTTKPDLFEELVHALESIEDEIDYDEVLASLWKREQMLNTRIAPGIAIPHTQVKHLARTTGVLGISRDGVDYELSDGDKVNLVVMFVDDEQETTEHLNTLRSFALLAKNQRFVDQILSAKDAKTVCEIIIRFEDMLS